MPVIFSRRKDRDEEPYMRPSLLQPNDSEESIASNATAPNIPGPGRNMGRLFDTIGGKIERVINETAGRYKIGPKASEGEHCKELDTLSNFSAELTETDSIASDATAPNIPGPGRIIGLLYDAAGSKMERFVNRTAGLYRLGPQAIVEDIQGSLSSVEKRGRDLGPSGFRVHLSPTDEEHAFLAKKCRKLLKYCRSHILTTQLEALEAVTMLAVNNPPIRQIFAGILQRSYLIPQYKERELHVGYCKALISVKETDVYDFIGRLEHSSNRIDRNEISEDDPGFRFLLHQFNKLLQDPDISFLVARLLKSGMPPSIYRSYTSFASTRPNSVEWDQFNRVFVVNSNSQYPDRCFDDVHVLFNIAPHFPVMQQYEEFGAFSTDSEFEDYPIDVVRFLNYLCGSSDLATQLSYLRTADEQTQSLLQGTACANEILVAYAHIQQHCWTAIQGMRAFKKTMKTGVRLLLNRLRSGNSAQRSLAWEAICRSQNSSRYFICALARHGESFNMNPFILADNLSMHSRRVFWANVECALPSENTMHVDDVLCAAWDSESDVVISGYNYLEVDGDDDPFSAGGHFPVLAGYDVCGKELYVAEVVHGDGHIFSYVPDGARSLSIADRNGEVRVCNRFRVLVLQYDPCVIGECSIPEGAKLQTGYVYWIRGEESMHKECFDFGDGPLEFSWAGYEVRYGVRVGVVKKADEEQGQDCLHEGVDLSLEDRAKSKAGGRSKMEMNSGLLQQGTSSVGEAHLLGWYGREANCCPNCGKPLDT
ncbi:hypothetical protein SCHPADRAFT_936566 [Schizopora paradoxa]|uniref:Uncharacterized protein n=1 Tax=Schizopora paradoxa TaxID=27342 RepID=A0A0H2S2M4_9AGAM|nr:hypothetical protein SCHPADRAFT_936566 [Schizopora paradoxa]